ncbi:GNAT family N-acetyltransferase [Burkholderiaceae bacterium DAT-1]|nr:GNAT family N-acetyltransferase [Burkholderiaceae bacterium DAT-1]
MNFQTASARNLSISTIESLARYRYRVFVQRLNWSLPNVQEGYEQDQFDLPDTIHIIARNHSDHIVGCGRLLPTTGRYLLESVFPQLLNGIEAPRHEKVWELSRFAAMDPMDQGAEGDIHMAERVLLQALRFCNEQAVTHLIAVSTTPVERLLQRAGVECLRFGPPEIIDGKPVLAFVIAVTARSIAALEQIEAAAIKRERPSRLQRSDGVRAMETLLELTQTRQAPIAALQA